MSTHSLIGVQRNDGSVRFVYCHFDGYLKGVGAEVSKLTRAEALVVIDAGDMRCIGEPFPDGEPPGLVDDVSEFGEMISRCGCEYGYVLTKNGTWKYATYDEKTFRSVKQALKSLKDR